MRHPQFPYLFSPLRVGSITIPNRIVFSAHLTNLAEHNKPGADLTAYYEERARGGVGLILALRRGLEMPHREPEPRRRLALPATRGRRPNG